MLFIVLSLDSFLGLFRPPWWPLGSPGCRFTKRYHVPQSRHTAAQDGRRGGLPVLFLWVCSFMHSDILLNFVTCNRSHWLFSVPPVVFWVLPPAFDGRHDHVTCLALENISGNDMTCPFQMGAFKASVQLLRFFFPHHGDYRIKCADGNQPGFPRDCRE